MVGTLIHVDGATIDSALPRVRRELPMNVWRAHQPGSGPIGVSGARAEPWRFDAVGR